MCSQKILIWVGVTLEGEFGITGLQGKKLGLWDDILFKIAAWLVAKIQILGLDKAKITTWEKELWAQ